VLISLDDGRAARLSSSADDNARLRADQFRRGAA
jgi:hypothetical protein